MLRQQLQSVHERIRQACQRANRQPSSVTLIAVTKGVVVARIQEAVALGLADLGENRVQEAREKQIALGSRLKALGKPVDLQPPALSLQPVRWHLIGHLQRNKARLAVELFDVIHSVDSVPLIEELERQFAGGSRLKARGKSRATPLEVLVQVNVSGEATKFGCRPDNAHTLVRSVMQQTHLKLSGLMMIAPFSANPEDARPYFRRLRELRDELASAFSLEPSAFSLSMGMSHDFEIAIEEGADMVRVGTAIFGKRECVNE